MQTIGRAFAVAQAQFFQAKKSDRQQRYDDD
jgi:hypothetical protein